MELVGVLLPKLVGIVFGEVHHLIILSIMFRNLQTNIIYRY